MKIGIVTLNKAFSYGAVLQAYALQTYLQKIGHEPFFINCKYRLHGPLVQRPALSLFRLRCDTVYTVNKWMLGFYFVNFQRTKHTVDSHRYNDFQSIQKNPPSADAFICGSDQIWRPHYCFSRDEKAVWLNFGNEHVRRVAYAASFGDLDLPEQVTKHWTPYMQRLDYVGVREKDAVEIAQKLGRSDAVWVPDPTLLLDASDYDPICADYDSKVSPSAFSYDLLTDWGLYCDVHRVIQKELGGPFHNCRPNDLRHNLLQGGLVTPGRWVCLLKKSTFVLTDSYHGLLFSLICHRPFIVLRKRPSRRIMSILQLTGLEDRFVDNADTPRIEMLCRQEIDWHRVDAKINQFRETGKHFLHNALSV